MQKFTAKSKELQLIRWDGNEETMQQIKDAFGIECFLNKNVVPFKLLVYLVGGNTAVISYGDYTGLNSDGEVVALESWVLDQFFDEVQEQVVEEKPKKAKKTKPE